MIRAPVNPALLRWARRRAGMERVELARRAALRKLPEWESGALQPTLRQLDVFARAVHVPVGSLFLNEPPPREELPIPDFRTPAGRPLGRPSLDLLDTVRACQSRQEWYAEFARSSGQAPRAFVASATLETPPKNAAAAMRATLGFDPNSDAREESRDGAQAFRRFVRQVEEAGVLVMVSGIVGSNTRRLLDVSEFRGFALADPLAPLVFVNGADAATARMFTLAHELAHLWLGASALSDATEAPLPSGVTEETWCNAAAAEFLVPLSDLRPRLRHREPLPDALPRLARIYKVSHLVILRRLLDCGWFSRAAFEEAWRHETQRLAALAERRRGGGGDFYRTTLNRVSRRFATALVEDTLEGRTLFRDAFHLLGVSKSATFDRLAVELGFPA